MSLSTQDSVLRFAADENFDLRILKGLRLRFPGLDVVRVQDVDLAGADNPTVLAWAAEDGRILLSHDVSTITRYAYDRLRQGLEMPGVFEVHDTAPIGRVIEDLLLVVESSEADDWNGQVVYLPF